MNTTLLNFNRFPRERVNETKLLGVHLDSQLKWHKKFMKEPYPYIRKSQYYINGYIFPLHTLRTLYISFILSHITYAITIYGLTYPTTLLPIIAARNTAFRAILFLKRRDSMTFAYPLLNVLPVKHCIDYHALILLYKITHKIVVYLSENCFPKYPCPIRSTNTTSNSLTIRKFTHTASHLYIHAYRVTSLEQTTHRPNRTTVIYLLQN